MRIIEPKFKGRGEGNYGPGYIGFSFRDNNFVSKGIVWFTTLDEFERVEVSHSFYVVDKETIIEAEGEGVIMSDPKKYFDSPHIHVFFRKPINLKPEYVERMTQFAFSTVGKSYDYGLFLNFLWQWFMLKVLRRDLPKKSPPLLDNPNAFMCSEVSASSLNQISEYSNLFPLSEWHPARIAPQLLAGSNEMFEPMRFDDALFNPTTKRCRESSNR